MKACSNDGRAESLAAKTCCKITERNFEPLDLRRAALRHVFTSTSASTKARKYFFHERAHIERLSRRLSEN